MSTEEAEYEYATHVVKMQAEDIIVLLDMSLTKGETVDAAMGMIIMMKSPAAPGYIPLLFALLGAIAKRKIADGVSKEDVVKEWSDMLHEGIEQGIDLGERLRNNPRRKAREN